MVPHFGACFFAAYGRCMEKQTKAQHIEWVLMFFFTFLSFHCMFSQWATWLDIMFWGIFTKAWIWSFYWYIIMYLSWTGKLSVYCSFRFSWSWNKHCWLNSFEIGLAHCVGYMCIAACSLPHSPLYMSHTTSHSKASRLHYTHHNILSLLTTSKGACSAQPAEPHLFGGKCHRGALVGAGRR